MTQVPYNKVLTNLASSRHAGKYWTLIAFCTDLTALSPYCHDLQCAALMLSHSLVRGYYILYSCVSQVLETTKFMNLIG